MDSSRRSPTSSDAGTHNKSVLKRERQGRLDFTPESLAVVEAKRRRLADQLASNQQGMQTLADGRVAMPTMPIVSSSSVSAASSLRRRAHSPQSKKKMVIRPFKVKPTLDAAFEEDSAAKLTQAVEAVYNNKSIDMSQEELYRAVEALCIHNKAAMLYEKLVSQCERHVAQLLQTIADQISHTSDEMSDVGMSIESHASSAILSVPFLERVQSTWLSHCEEMMIIRGIFLYLDRTYVIQLATAPNAMHNHADGTTSSSPQPKSLWDMGLGLFCAQLKRHPLVEEKVVSGLIALIERERLGESVNRSLIKSLLRMLTALKLYAASFQPPFLAATAAFYEAESQRTIASSTPIEYIHYIQQRLHQEEDRATAYLDDTSRAPLTSLLHLHLIQTHSTAMLGSSLQQLLDQKRSVELGIMYQLFQRIRALDQIKESFGAYVKQTASNIVQSGSTDPAEATAPAAAASAPAASPSPAAGGTSTPATMIIDLLSLKATLDDVLTHSFASNADFLSALKVSFEAALNLVENKPAEMIAKFIDKVLRTGGKGIKITSAPTTGADAAGASSIVPTASSSAAVPSSVGGGVEEVESLLDAVMFLFRYIHGKDVFQAFYKKDLAKRLLLAKSASVDAEKSMIAKIKNECGASFTTKIEGMFKDIDLSKETQAEYDQHRQQQLRASQAASSDDAAAPPMELSVQVLTTGSWPAYTPVECTLPRDVARMHEDFKLFYLNKHSGRKLIWHHSLATAVLRAHFKKARKELAVSGMQAIVLMLFNEHEKLTLDEIGRYSGITDVMELKRTIASLTFSEEVRILLKEPRNKKLQSGDVFSVNAEFSYKLFRIKINTVQMKETKEEQKSTTTRVFEDRQYALDAAIVRIMKARKTLSHQLLIMEVIQQVKFPTRPADIKKRIASLIEREYMERDKDDSATYVYMA